MQTEGRREVGDKVGSTVLGARQGREGTWGRESEDSVALCQQLERRWTEEESGDGVPSDTEEVETWGTQAPTSTQLVPSGRI